MKKLFACFAVLAAVSLSSSVASAAGLCINDVGQNVLGGFSCSIGGLTFSSFNSNTNSSQGVTISAVVGNSLILSPNLPTDGSPSMADIHLWFQVAGGVSGVGGSINGLATAFVQETVCDAGGLANPAASGICLNTPLALFTMFGGQPQKSVTFASTDPIWIFKDINTGGGAVSEVTQVFTTSSVPEPMTLSMMGAGLLGLSLISRRRKKS